MRWVGYQQSVIADRSPRKVVNKSRRIGISEAYGFEGAMRLVGVEILPGRPPKQVPRISQNIVSASQRQAIELLETTLHHVKALGHGTVGDIVSRESATYVKLTTGEVARAFSNNPRSIRGAGGDLTMDEMPHIPRLDQVWAAAAPLARPTLKHRTGYHIRCAGSPLGDDNLFYKLCRDPEYADEWSRHEIDWRMALADGFPFDEDQARKEYPDPDIFAQEFECSFLSSDMRYIPAEVFDAAVYDYDDLPKLPGERFGGMDVARHRDNSAIVQALRIADVLYHEETEARRDVSWDDQEAWVHDVVAPEHRRGTMRFCVDSTGLGSQFAERLEQAYPGIVEGVGFTSQTKDELATGLKLALQRHKFRPRRDDTDLRLDVLNLRRIVTAANNVRFDAPRDKSGHADRAWAAALCVHAAGGAAKSHAMTRGGAGGRGAGGGKLGRSGRRAGRDALRGV